MLHIFDALRDLSLSSIILRLFLASIMGMILGIERSYSNRAAGFRTHMLVCIAGCVTAMTAIDLYIYQHIATDPTRLPAQIITGLGFLGAGTIFVTKKSTIQGLTTAAGMWTAGIVGIAIGAGFFEGGILAGILVIAAETSLFGRVGKVQHLPDFRLVIHYGTTDALDNAMRYIKDHRMRIRNLQIESENDGNETAYTAVLTIRTYKKTDHQALIKKIGGIKGVISVNEI